MNSPRWEQDRELGSGRALRWFAAAVRWIGPTLGRIAVVPVWLYFLLTQRSKRALSRQYLARALGRTPTTLDVARHFWAFSCVTLDRVFLLSRGERGYRIAFDGLDVLANAVDQGRGCVLLGAHHGSFEVCRVVQQQRPEVRLKVLLNRARTRNAEALFEALNPGFTEQIIDASGDPAAIGLSLAAALREQAVVGVLADRVSEREAAIKIDFLGVQARFPVAPFVLASAANAPVLLFFGLFEGGNRYRIQFESFDAPRLDRKNRQQALARIVARYSHRLAARCRTHPYNWFNFYNYWDS